MKKAIIGCVIAVVLIIAAVVVGFAVKLNLSTDFAKGTQVEVVFNQKDITEEAFESYRAELQASLVGKGYITDHGMMLRANKDIYGVRFTIVGEVSDFSGVASQDMTLTSYVLYPTSEYSVWTIAWVLLISFAVIFVYVILENRKRRPFASAFTVLVVSVLSVLMSAALYIIAGLVFPCAISLYTVCGLAFAAAFAGIASIGVLRGVKNGGCACKWLMPAGIVGIIGMVVFGLLGSVSLMVIGIVAIISAVFTSLVITKPYAETLFEKK